MTEKPEPPVSPEVDLKDFAFTPLYRARLFGSSFHARANDAEWRAGLTLWLKSQDQVPAGSLPKDDVDLCRLAELGRDMRTWRKIKEMALHGWFECSDGRLYNAVVADVVAMQWSEKLHRLWKTDCARAKKHCQRRGLTFSPPPFDQWMSQGQTCNVPGDDDEPSSGQKASVPRENGSKGREVKGSEASSLRIPSQPETSESVAAREVEDREDLNPVVRLAPPPQAPNPSGLHKNIKDQLRQKLMRYCNCRMSGEEKSCAIMGLMGEDKDHDAQWWLDEIDRRRKRENWDDTRDWKHQHLGVTH